MSSKAKEVEERLAKLKQTTAEGNAGIDQAKTATEQKQRREKRKKTATGKSKGGRSVSMFRSAEDDRLILHLVSEMAAKGIRVNESQILRAGLRALDQLPLSKSVVLVEESRYL